MEEINRQNKLEWLGIDLHLHSPKDVNHNFYKEFSASGLSSISEFEKFTNAIKNGIKQTNIKLVAISDHNIIHYDDIQKLNKKFKGECHFLYAAELTFIQKNGKLGDIIIILDDKLTIEQCEAFIVKIGELIAKYNYKKQSETKDILPMKIEDISEILGFLYDKKIDFIISPHILKSSKPISKDTMDFLEENKLLHSAEASKTKNIRGLMSKITDDNYTLPNFASDCRQKEIAEQKNIWSNQTSVTSIYSTPSFKGLVWTVYKNKKIYTKHIKNDDNNIHNFLVKESKYDDFIIKSIKINGKTIFLDRYFNSIIGERGSGKSAIANYIETKFNASVKSKKLRTDIKIDYNSNMLKKVNVITQKLFAEYSGYYNDFEKYFKEHSHNLRPIDSKIDINTKKDAESFADEILKFIRNKKQTLSDISSSFGALSLDTISNIRDKSTKDVYSNFQKYIKKNIDKISSDIEKVNSEIQTIETSILNLIKILNIEVEKTKKEKYWEKTLQKFIVDRINLKRDSLEKRLSLFRKINQNKNFTKIIEEQSDNKYNKWNELKLKCKEYIESSFKIDSFHTKNPGKISANYKEYKKNENTKLVETKQYSLKKENIIEHLLSNIKKSKSKAAQLKVLNKLDEVEFMKKVVNVLDEKHFKEKFFKNNKYILNSTNEKTIIYKRKNMKEASPGEWAEFMIDDIIGDLSAGSTPILFDQPDDDLDNRTIYNNLIKKLNMLVKDRQIIVITHNANIVFNCDTSLYLMCYKKSGSFFIKGKPFEMTTDDEFAETINILEGGIEAFEKRREKYNANIYNKNKK